MDISTLTWHRGQDRDGVLFSAEVRELVKIEVSREKFRNELSDGSIVQEWYPPELHQGYENRAILVLVKPTGEVVAGLYTANANCSLDLTEDEQDFFRSMRGLETLS